MKKKLIITGPIQFGYNTDTYKYCQYLKEEFEITFIGFDEGKEKIKTADIKVLYVDANRRIKRKWQLICLTIKEAKKYKNAAVFITYFRFASIIKFFLPFHKCILDFRTGSVSHHKLKKKFKNFNMWLEASFFSTITTLSEDLKVHLKLPARTKILPLGSDIKSQTEKRFDELRLLYVGTLKGRNIHETIYGIAQFRDNYPNVSIKYFIAGPGDCSLIRQEIEKYNLTTAVEILGYVTDEESSHYYDTCNIGVCYAPMTDFYMPQPFTKLYEYGMAGMAVVSVKLLDSVRRVNDKIGVVCEDTPESFALALEEIYNHRFNYKSETIRSYFSPWSWEKITEQFKSIINE